MPLGDFADPGTMLKPLPIGRMARFVAGIGALGYFVWNLMQASNLIDSDEIPVGYLIAIGFAWWYFSDLVVVGFSRNWGRWPMVAVLPVVLSLVAASLLVDGNVWGPPLGWGLFLFAEFFFGFIGINFLLASIFAVPG